MHVARDPHPLFFDDLEDLPGCVAQPGGAVGRPGIGSEEVVEAAIDRAQHLLLGADPGEPCAELDLTLLGGREIGSDLGQRAKGAVDLIDVTRRQHAQQRTPASFGLVLRGAEFLQTQCHRSQLIVERGGRRVQVLDALGHQEPDTGQCPWIHGGGHFDFAQGGHHVTAKSHRGCSSQMAVTGLLHAEPQVAASV